jgi:hypothetical protein
MAEELQIGRNGERVKLRSPWAVALLPFITLGIYHLVWWYRINREMRDLGHDRGVDLGQSPTNSLLALFPGGLIIVPALVSYWRGTKRVMATGGIAGTEPVNGWIALILYIVLFPAFAAYLQVSLNHAWVAVADRATVARALVADTPGAQEVPSSASRPTAPTQVDAEAPPAPQRPEIPDDTQPA